MERENSTDGRKSFGELRKRIDADPQRRARVEDHKAAMLRDLRRELDLTQAEIADRLNVSQANVSQIERGESDIRVSTLTRYVEALGGRLEVRAVFPDACVKLRVGKDAEIRKKRAVKIVEAKGVKPKGVKPNSPRAAAS
jgi:transcriptional regulator with XRE-family HTH domain